MNVATPANELFSEVAKMPLFWANLTAAEKIIVNQGGTYSGKTEAIVRVLFYLATLHGGLTIDIVASTVPKLKEDTMKVAARVIKENPALKKYLSGSFNKSDRYYTFKNGTVINFKSYENSEQAEGPKRDILYINEAGRLDWNTAKLLILRTNTKVFLDYNPTSSMWCHDKIINCQPNEQGIKEYPSVKVIRSWHIHNHFIPQEKHDEIENIADKELHKAYARGLTAQVSGLVYPGWVEIEAFPENHRDIIWGIDLGFTQDPTVMLKCAINCMGFDYIFDEHGYAPGIPSGDMAHIMKENGYVYPQPAYMDHKDSIRRELRQLRIVAINALKTKGSEEAGILHLRTKRVAYTKRSTNLKEEIRRHMFATDGNGNNLNVGMHQFSHGPAAARYAAFTHSVRYGLIKGYKEEITDET